MFKKVLYLLNLSSTNLKILRRLKKKKKAEIKLFEMKSVMPEIKNIWDGINSSLHIAELKTSKLKYIEFT